MSARHETIRASLQAHEAEAIAFLRDLVNAEFAEFTVLFGNTAG